MTDWISRLAVPAVLGLTPYVPGRPVEDVQRELGLTSIIKLASNENPLGPSPAVAAALQRALGGLGRYPDGGGFRLKARLASKLGVEPDMLTLGNGSNDVLEMIGRTFSGAGDEVVLSRYAFIVYALVTQAVGATAVVVPDCDWGHDLDAMAAAVTPRTRLVYLANPNNPTGTCVGNADLRRFLGQITNHVLVVLDEAYFEYFEDHARPDGVQLLREHRNLIVCRTFSKAFGLAGLRCGYAVSRPEVAALLNRVRQAFNVNSLAQEAALAALEDSEHLRRSVQVNRDGLRQLTQGLAAQGVETIPSSANFITARLGAAGSGAAGSGAAGSGAAGSERAAAINRALLRRGVIVRPLEPYGMGDWLRISVGLTEENQVFLDVLAEIFAGTRASGA